MRSRYDGSCRFFLPVAILTIAIISGCNNPVSPGNAAKGEQIFNISGCNKCHSLKGENMYGPPLTFTPGEEIAVFRGNDKVTVSLDRDYIIRSITQPEAEKLEGYDNKKMTPVNLTSKEIDLIADYLIYINTKKK